ncbi:hypothetical protein HMP06_0326 [Sphingomonas sp. HMP6]|nr:hypothetical protein HMP06_0326 [Sphingomonas sp. HMP6]
MDGGMIVPNDLIGQRQRGGVKNARLAAKKLQQAGSFLDAKPGIGSLAQGPVEQQDARGRITGPQPEGGTFKRIAAIERWKMVRIGERAKRHYRLSLMASAASVTNSTGIVSVAPTLK